MSKKLKQLKEKYESLLIEHRKILKIVDNYTYRGLSKEEAFNKILKVIYGTSHW